MALRAVLWSMLLLLAACGEAPAPEEAALDLSRALGGPSEGFERAVAVRTFAFPADHGPHPGFRTEWWYVTGNLADGDGARYGFQLTLFRIALAPRAAERDSAWATSDVYMGHFALTDARAGRFEAWERFARAGAGLAGAQAVPFAVWLEDWRIEADAEGRWRLRASAEGSAIELELEAVKPVVLQGDRGLSQKGEAAGNASYYYSLPRLRAAGRLVRDGQVHAVSGSAWLDREWSTSALSPEQAGWDWFALQLDDGRELMYYRLRRRDGSADRHSAGVLIERDGSARALRAEAVRLTPTQWWESPRGGRYPVEWRLELVDEGLRIEVQPLVRDQELAATVRYWEGAVQLFSAAGAPIGHGYLELTGYARGADPRGVQRW